MYSTKNVTLLDTKLSLLDTKGLLDAIGTFVDSHQKAVVASGNVHSFNIVQEKLWYKDFLNNADIVRLDGAGLRLGARILGHKTPKRNTWADFGWSLAEFCEKNNYKLFFFGGKPGVAEDAAACLRRKYPKLEIAGTEHGYIDMRPDSVETNKLIQQINKTSPDILIVGLGMPLQEQWLAQNRDKLNVSVAMTGGAVFDYLSGRTRRAPNWMRNHSLEWLFRLFQDPRRMWKRYLIGNPLFLFRIFKEKLSMPSQKFKTASAKVEENTSCYVLNICVTKFTVESLHRYIAQIITERKKAVIANVNTHAMNLACDYPWFRSFLNNSDCTFCDGYGVMLAARASGEKIPERITYADWLPALAAFCTENRFSLFLLGAKPGVAKTAADRLQEQNPGLNVCGSHHGYFDKNRESEENRKVIDVINKTKPHILLVCFGMPLQEKWLSENWNDIDANLALPAGAALDYAAGIIKRPPRWMTKYGFEWLGRLLLEPRRLWKRYLIGIPVFFCRVVVHSLTKRRF